VPKRTVSSVVKEAESEALDTTKKVSSKKKKAE
jgi:hypothetical protein